MATIYRHEEAKKNQEVVTPPELLMDIYKHLKLEDLTGDILDPCVGPGAMIKPFLKNGKYNSITVCDIQEEHIENLKIYIEKIHGNKMMISDSFLDYDFEDKRYDLIIMNPPWTKLGKLFIDKASKLLKPNGKLVTIVGYKEFTKAPVKSGTVPGTFLDLQNRGSFERIETFQGCGDGDIFNGKGDWCWFIWNNDKHTNFSKDVILVNKMRNEFTYSLEGNEYFVPQCSEEKHLFNWNGNTKFKQLSSNNKVKEKSTVLYINKTNGLKISTINEDNIHGVASVQAPYSENILEWINKLQSTLSDIEIYKLYATGGTGHTLRFPPLKTKED